MMVTAKRTIPFRLCSQTTTDTWLAFCLIAPLWFGAATATLASDLTASNGEAPVATTVTSRCQGVRLELRTSTTPQGRLTFIGMLINEGTQTVTLVEPGDGSDVGWRTPIVTWKVTTPDGTPVAPPGRGARCGNRNRVNDSEIFDLAPGQGRALGGWLGEPQAPPGTYVIRLVYENDPARKPSGVQLGPTSDTALGRIARSTPCTVESPPVTAELVGRGLGPLAPE